ncbi:MAG: aspartyl-phosphate phosphatase Spo0E family protein [Clostridiaceae bacterium]|nr:aspartyl-phosphate phosphatase Spo0E family protein [Clostridiaceae bacterium]
MDNIQLLKNKIEVSREELHSLIANSNNLSSEEIIKKSQYLDELLSKYHEELKKSTYIK